MRRRKLLNEVVVEGIVVQFEIEIVLDKYQYLVMYWDTDMALEVKGIAKGIDRRKCSSS